MVLTARVLSLISVAASLVLGAPPSTVRNDARTNDGSNSSNCKEVTFNVNGSAQNRNITGVDLTDIPSLLLLLQADTFPRFLVKGGQTLAATYCTPTKKNANNEKIQVLFHGITKNRGDWSAQGGTGVGFPAYKPEKYSWVRYFNNEGYATLAVDRLGDGKSSHPEPVLVNQGTYETALYHDLIQQIRNGTTCSLPRKYNTVYWVGHSYGSELGTLNAQRYPDDIDAYLLTGLTKSVQPSLPGMSLQMNLPAAVVMPSRFHGLNPGYITSSIAQARTDSFFGSHKVVEFDQKNADFYFTREDVISAGQFVSSNLGPVTAPKYKGRVMVLTGENDQAFCGPGSSAINPAPTCGPLLAETKSLFPAADYNYKSVARTGHVLMLHSTVGTTHNIAKQFLAGGSFHGGPPA